MQRLSELQQLLHVELELASLTQLQHLQLPQLQTLMVVLQETSQQQEGQVQQHLQQQQQQQQQQWGEGLQLGHLTGLRSLRILPLGDAPPATLRFGDQLPPNLREIRWNGLGNVASYSVQPLLALSSLTGLTLGLNSSPSAAALSTQLMRLSMLSSLQNVSLSYFMNKSEPVSSAAAAAMMLGNHTNRSYWRAWAALPLKSLEYWAEQVPAAVVDQLGSLRSLTSLVLASRTGQACRIVCNAQQLAAAVQQLTNLQRLHINKAVLGYVGRVQVCTTDANEAPERQRVDGIEALAKVIGSHAALQVANVWLWAELSGPAAQELDSRLRELDLVGRSRCSCDKRRADSECAFIIISVNVPSSLHDFKYLAAA
jgi:hypothetical protein